MVVKVHNVYNQRFSKIKNRKCEFIVKGCYINKKKGYSKILWIMSDKFFLNPF